MLGGVTTGGATFRCRRLKAAVAADEDPAAEAEDDAGISTSSRVFGRQSATAAFEDGGQRWRPTTMFGILAWVASLPEGSAEKEEEDVASGSCLPLLSGGCCCDGGGGR